MAKNWCKIIELEEHDVLVQKEFDNDIHCLIVTFKEDDEDLTMKATIGIGKDKEKANEAFKNFSEENAKILIKQLIPS